MCNFCFDTLGEGGIIPQDVTFASSFGVIFIDSINSGIANDFV